MSNGLRITVVVLGWLLALPAAGFAQSAITGVVRDSSGGVLPGVTVEAASAALIEGARTAITDDQGLYRLVDLRPGTYNVSFSLPGFNSFKREGLQLAAEFTATINAELRVGALEESIIVTGAAPVVDATRGARAQVLDREAIDSIPTGRSIQGMAQLVPGVSLSLPDTGGARAMQQTYMSTRGMTTANTTMLVDGLMVNGLWGDWRDQSYFNDAMNQEAHPGERLRPTSAGGVRMNMIPRDGGNRFSDYGGFRPVPQSSNLTNRHVERLWRNAIDRIFDTTLAVGGPIMRNKLWFFMTGRYFSVNNFIANTVQDDGSRGLDDQFIKSGLARLTWQISPRNKISGYFDEIDKFRGHDMQQRRPERPRAVVSPAYHTAAITHRRSRTRCSSRPATAQPRYYTNSYQTAWSSRVSIGWLPAPAPRKRSRRPPHGRHGAEHAESRTAFAAGHADVSVGRAQLQGRRAVHVGRLLAHRGRQRRPDAAVSQQQHGRPLLGARQRHPQHAAALRRAPQPRSGLFVQDSWRLNRLTVNAGVRWENIKQVLASESPAGLCPCRCASSRPSRTCPTGATGRRASRPCSTCSATARRP
jgi:hypothetical protein